MQFRCTTSSNLSTCVDMGSKIDNNPSIAHCRTLCQPLISLTQPIQPNACNSLVSVTHSRLRLLCLRICGSLRVPLAPPTEPLRSTTLLRKRGFIAQFEQRGKLGFWILSVHSTKHTFVISSIWTATTDVVCHRISVKQFYASDDFGFCGLRFYYTNWTELYFVRLFYRIKQFQQNQAERTKYSWVESSRCRRDDSTHGGLSWKQKLSSISIESFEKCIIATD